MIDQGYKVTIEKVVEKIPLHYTRKPKVRWRVSTPANANHIYEDEAKARKFYKRQKEKYDRWRREDEADRAERARLNDEFHALKDRIHRPID